MAWEHPPGLRTSGPGPDSDHSAQTLTEQGSDGVPGHEPGAGVGAEPCGAGPCSDELIGREEEGKH